MKVKRVTTIKDLFRKKKTEECINLGRGDVGGILNRETSHNPTVPGGGLRHGKERQKIPSKDKKVAKMEQHILADLLPQEKLKK